MGVPADEVTLEAIAKANAAIDAANPGKAASTPAVKKVEEFKKYRRKQISELRPYEAGEDLAGVSVSDADKKAGSPKLGDMIARNPSNHADRWLVAKKYFDENLELVSDQVVA
jgi:hypothetical protein